MESDGTSVQASSGSTGGKLNRRALLRLAGFGTGALLIGSCRHGTEPSRGAAGARVDASASPTGATREITLEAGLVPIDFGAQRLTSWGYNGTLPGPEIRLKQGDRLRATVRNRLPAETTIHWHGLPIPNSMDGVPNVTQPAIKAGEDFTYDFTVPVSGSYLYHSHAGLQLDRALYGALIVEPRQEPLSYDREFTLVIDDWLDGLPGTPEETMRQLVAQGDTMAGMGDMGAMGSMAAPPESPPDVVYPRYLINGRPAETPLELTVKQGERVRLRLINPSGATIYRIALAGHRLQVTHADGQPVEPVEVDVVRLGMGERYDVLVTMNRSGVWQLAAAAEGTSQLARAVVRYQGSVGAPPPPDAVPGELRGQLLLYPMLKAAPTLQAPPPTQPEQVFPVKLAGGGGQYVWTINDAVFASADPIAVPRGRHIRFTIQNMSMMPHPMHLHGHFFQLVNGTGRGPLKDTVVVEPMQSLSLDWVADNPGRWAFHCHNLYHQDAGMMRVVNVG